MKEKLLNRQKLQLKIENKKKTYPYYPVQVPLAWTEAEDNESENKISIQFLYIYSWINTNAQHHAYITRLENIFGDEADSPSIVWFESMDDAEFFKNWFQEFCEEFASWPKEYQTKLWPDKEDINELISRGETLTIAGTVKYQLYAWDNEHKVNKRVRDVFHWLNTNCKGAVYRYNGMFAFEDPKEATMFKLRWLEDGNEKDKDGPGNTP